MKRALIASIFFSLTVVWAIPTHGQNTLLRDIETSYQFDGFGNPKSITVTSGDGYHNSIGIRYSYNPSLWLMAMPNELRMRSSTPSGQSTSRTTQFNPDLNTGAVLSQTVEPQAQESTFNVTLYNLDAHGVSTGFTSSDASGRQHRSLSFQMDPLEDIFPVLRTNALGQTESVLIYPSLGVVAAHVDLNGVVEAWQYDGFGRPKNVLPADGANVSITYTGPAFDVNVNYAGGQVQDVLYDPYLFEVQRDTTGFAGQTIVQLTSYNGQNLILEKQGPCFYGAPSCASTGLKHYSYDELGRLIQVTNGDGNGPRWTHTGLKTLRRDAIGNQRYTVKDQLGRLVKSVAITDGGREIPTSFTYEPFGLLHSVTDAASNTMSADHDVRGRPHFVHDPDSGDTHYNWTCFNQLDNSKDGNGSVFSYSYDALGRVRTITTKDGPVSFEWDIARHGIGKLASATSTDGVTTNYEYNPLGQLDRSAWTMKRNSYVFRFSYDPVGRLYQTTYPSTAGGPAFVIQDNYNPYGFLYQVIDASSRTAFWQVDAESERGQISAEHFANGISTQRTFNVRGRVKTIQTTGQGLTEQNLAYDYYGNGSLKSRSNQFFVNGFLYRLDESLLYDPLDRLKNLQSTGTFVPPPHLPPRIFDETFVYDDVGNLKQRTINVGSGTSLAYQYGQSGAGPHAVTQVNSDTYQYNSGGNQVLWDAAHGDSRSYGYSAFNLPTSITLTNSGNPNPNQYSFEYDAYQHRASKQFPTGDGVTYAGKLYQRRVQSGQVTEVFSVPSAHGRIVAQIERAAGASGNVIHYLHDDSLGSVQVTTSQAGKTEEQLWYEPFGQTVEPDNPGLPVAPTLATITEGFTAQREDLELKLVDMVGRIYDPQTGRFLTPDPLIQNFSSNESLDRYTYARNNPFKWIDPSGFQGSDPSDGSSCDQDCSSNNNGESNAPSGGNVSTIYLQSSDWAGTIEVGLSPTVSDNGAVFPSPDAVPLSGWQALAGPGTQTVSEPAKESVDWWSGSDLAWLSGGLVMSPGAAKDFGAEMQHATAYLPNEVYGIAGYEGFAVHPMKMEGALIAGVTDRGPNYVLDPYVGTIAGTGLGVEVPGLDGEPLAGASWMGLREDIWWSGSGADEPTAHLNVLDGEIGDYGGGVWKTDDETEAGAYVYRSWGEFYLGMGAGWCKGGVCEMPPPRAPSVSSGGPSFILNLLSGNVVLPFFGGP